MIKTFMAGALLTGLFTIPAAADECGRWVPCAPSSKLSQDDISSYVYGNRSHVEPWIAEEKKVAEPKMVEAVPAPAPVTATPLPGASKQAEEIRLIDNVARQNEARAEEKRKDDLVDANNQDAEDQGDITLSPSDEAAARAYIAKVDAARAAQAPKPSGAFDVSGSQAQLNADE